eukprot:TRINITY_DN43476_c0_g1_i1.p1 TRINITY_DN43476_c0_g1~~TRINITY_DN43476_c0_g1_i1.p1  ORF type:complete len:292 (+),score=61.55 TRINITY_DN43476_c0_g1_i1:132-1007(+)
MRVLLLCVLLVQAVCASRTVLAWWPCMGKTDTELDEGVQWFANRTGAVTTASPTTHKLGSNSSLVEFDFAANATHTASSLFAELRSNGVRVLPIIYNDESSATTLLPKLRSLFAAPSRFVQELVSEAIAHDLDGWNLDFELGATEKVTAADGMALAKFVDLLGNELAAHGKTVSIDIGTWQQPLWNIPALNASSLGRALDMSTYGDKQGDPADFRRFVTSMGRMLDLFSCSKIGVGFCPACLNQSRPFTAAQLGARFGLIETLECVQEIDMWVNDCPDEWLPYLRKFVMDR